MGNTIEDQWGEDVRMIASTDDHLESLLPDVDGRYLDTLTPQIEEIWDPRTVFKDGYLWPLACRMEGLVEGLSGLGLTIRFPRQHH